MIKVVHTLGRVVRGDCGCRVGGSFVVFGCFVDVKEGLACGGIGFVWSLAVGVFENSVGAVLSCNLAGRADMVAFVVLTSRELTFVLLFTNCGVVSKDLVGIALAIGLYVSVCSTPCLYSSNK